MTTESPSSGASPAFRRFSLFPRSLGQTLSQVVKPVYKKHGFAEHRLLTEWKQVVGEELAACSVPQKLSFKRGQKEGGTLHVQVSGARALELQHMQPVILDRIATYFGYLAVARLAFTQVSSQAPRKHEPQEEQKGRDTGAYAELANRCEDESLRKALASLAEALPGS